MAILVREVLLLGPGSFCWRRGTVGIWLEGGRREARFELAAGMIALESEFPGRVASISSRVSSAGAS